MCHCSGYCGTALISFFRDRAPGPRCQECGTLILTVIAFTGNCNKLRAAVSPKILLLPEGGPWLMSGQCKDTKAQHPHVNSGKCKRTVQRQRSLVDHLLFLPGLAYSIPKDVLCGALPTRLCESSSAPEAASGEYNQRQPSCICLY